MQVNRRGQQGFTLIEMMISLLLGLIIVGGTIMIYLSISGVSDTRERLANLQNELIFVHQTLTRSVSVAKSVEVVGDHTLIVHLATDADIGSNDDNKDQAAKIVHEDCRGKVNSNIESITYEFVAPGDGDHDKKRAKLYCHDDDNDILIMPLMANDGLQDIRFYPAGAGVRVELLIDRTLGVGAAHGDAESVFSYHLAPRSQQ